MLIIIWTVAALNAKGDLMLQDMVDTSVKFEQRQSCDAFGKVMTPRMKDFVRGMLRAPWDQQIEVQFRCEVDGEPV